MRRCVVLWTNTHICYYTEIKITKIKINQFNCFRILKSAFYSGQGIFNDGLTNPLTNDDDFPTLKKQAALDHLYNPTPGWDNRIHLVGTYRVYQIFRLRQRDSRCCKFSRISAAINFSNTYSLIFIISDGLKQQFHFPLHINITTLSDFSYICILLSLLRFLWLTHKFS